MRIDKLHIDGFGVFHDKTIQGFKPGINVIFGNNEAGKSTLLDFIRFTLFEYPHWHQDRRQPLKGGTHGGRIWLENSFGESLSVYRHGNAKDFQLEYNGDKSDNEKLYQQLIGNASIDLYKNIYAITLDELTNVEQLSKSGMEDRIFSMGMGLSGVDFGGFEKELTEHSLDYFKARGSVQILPRLASEIVEKEESINKLRNKLGKYNRLSEHKEKLAADLELLTEERSKLSQEKNTFSDLSKAYPDFVKYKSAQGKIEEIGEIEMHAVQVLEEYERLKSKLIKTDEELSLLSQKINQLENEIDQFQWNKELSKHASLLDFFKTNVKLYEEAKTKLSQEREKLSHANNQTKTILKRLGDEFSASGLIALEGTFKLQTEANNVIENQQKINRLIDSSTDAKNRLLQDISGLESNQSRSKKELLEFSIQNYNEREKANELRIALDTAFKSAIENRGVSVKSPFQLPIILVLLFFIVGLGLLFLHFISGIFVLIISLITLMVLLVQKRRNPVETLPSKNPNEINKELDEVSLSIQRFDQWKEKSDENLHQLQLKYDEFHKVEESLLRLEEQLSKVHNQWMETLEKSQLPTSLLPTRINEFISLVEELKRQNNNHIEAEKAIENKEILISEYESELRKVNAKQSELDATFIYSLISKIEENEKINSKRKQFIDQINRFSNEKEVKIKNLENITIEIDALLSSLNFKNETEFYTHFQCQSILKEELEKQRLAIATIQTLCGADQWEYAMTKLTEYSPSALNVKREETDANYELVKTKHERLIQEIATTNTEIRHLLEIDEMYGLQIEKESLQAQLKEETKEWLATRLALEVLNQSKQKYEKEKQPEVITQTRKYFRLITNNAYDDLRISLSEKHVSILDASGNSKSVQELSRGTREQLLLSLRLGLIAEYEKNNEALPIAFDDIMVNFDAERTENLAEILISFAAERQVLYFTCHEHTKRMFEGLGANVVEWKR